ncbi:protein sidekick-1 [Thunnus albacares]|uniref:protein sidekick-1 n=1 Tax=Thunnus albacares TaxID=8236 RepID=UPI001CF60CBF|nr:protein sidekick-1 [Thunnus albacares]
MVGRGFRLDFLHSKFFSSTCHSHFFILGLILAHAQASSASCKSKNISALYQHCGLHRDGVHDLHCFNKHDGTVICEWKPGYHTAKKTYTLIIQQQDKFCLEYKNVDGNSAMIKLFKKYNMTAQVFENIESTNCTKAVFRGSAGGLLRCGPPDKVTFSRDLGKLFVNVSWQKNDIKVIKNYSVTYNALGSLLGSKLSAQSKIGEINKVENLNSSLAYVVQVKCVTNDKCKDCPWSDTYTVPPELTTRPVIVKLQESDIAERKGCRLLFLKWKFATKELHDGYRVTIGKASGEALRERINVTQPEMRLILSYSAYRLNIKAFNNVSISPAVTQMIPQREGVEAGKLNVTVNSETSFTIYWKDDLIKTYVCYSVEWREKGHKAAGMSFYRDADNHRTLSPLKEPLEPYKRYSITLHTRPNKDTCNMKHVNNSESTYGSTQFYFIEGSPVSAPTNISIYNVTLNSVELQWSSIPEEDVRGFLLGYIIHYIEYHHRETHTEINITVDPEFNSYKLGDLKSDTTHQVQISAFTRAGAGVRSTATLFKTNHQDYFSASSTIIVFTVLAIVVMFGAPIIKRAKVILWPSIPNPGHSNTMQKIDGPCELELLESINILKVEEWDTNSLHIVEKEAVIPVITLPSTIPLLRDSEDEEESPEMTCDDWFQRDSDDTTGDIIPHATADAFSDTQQTNLQSSPCAFSSEYTTMEMFQQVIPQGTPANTSVTEAMESEPEDIELTVMKSGLDYLGHFGTSPVLDSEEISTFLERCGT